MLVAVEAEAVVEAEAQVVAVAEEALAEVAVVAGEASVEDVAGAEEASVDVVEVEALAGEDNKLRSRLSGT